MKNSSSRKSGDQRHLQKREKLFFFFIPEKFAGLCLSIWQFSDFLSGNVNFQRI
jgi:hypothetical protein